MNLSDNWTAGQQQIVRVSAAEAVFQAIRAAIENGQLQVGAKLSSETALASQYGVSRSVIREALRSCTALGLTETQTGKGTFVIANRASSDLVLGDFSARSLMEARPHIEVPAAEFAATRRTAEQLEEMRGILDLMAEEDDPQIWVNLDAAFHAAIARASGNGVFESVVNDIRDAMASQSETINLITGRARQSNLEHQKILDAITRGATADAGRAMSVHLSAVDTALGLIMGENA
ncbi:DNA-binding FadR family transcriptional regulator [Arthrobacter stackebrandtii]|uniref:DNA-binding FadR family transcriptional regulator n=1 Tax=Arthrobacter stackebrandtii TaxID=272161 RepID=A0ABS4YSR6_9MICC|nr:FCD domain-containing protein [Arthrobacter stackebrandtii]MBP2411831.1 DNA-binding FadR family transcriptional regulator [Arthrobacter stackebrandtii]PYG99131.1 GntR family transcriptional regulator [Arthrobacter stackebrandtii]